MPKSYDVFAEIEDVDSFLSEMQKSLEETNRFFPDIRLQEALNQLLKCKSIERVITEGTILYRGRIYFRDQDNAEKKPPEFEGYDKEGSWINLSDSYPKAGRMNPEGIQVLYVSTGEKTCAKELGTAANEKISIASMRVKESLRIADFPNAACRVRNVTKKEFANRINDILSTGYGGRTYIFPQYLAMFCRNFGYDGIMYRSKYANKDDRQMGLNLAIFDFKKCEPVSSTIKVVKRVSLEFYK